MESISLSTVGWFLLAIGILVAMIWPWGNLLIFGTVNTRPKTKRDKFWYVAGTAFGSSCMAASLWIIPLGQNITLADPKAAQTILIFFVIPATVATIGITLLVLAWDGKKTEFKLEDIGWYLGLIPTVLIMPITIPLGWLILMKLVFDAETEAHIRGGGA